MNQASTSPAKQLTSRGKRTRQQLLDAAELVFGEKGFEQSSIAEITQRAEVALGTFYVYFENKHAIFVELVEQLGERLRKTTTIADVGTPTIITITRRELWLWCCPSKACRCRSHVVVGGSSVDVHFWLS